MARSTIGGDDPENQLSADEKDKREKELRKLARDALKNGEAKLRRELENRAKNISRKPSGSAQHH